MQDQLRSVLALQHAHTPAPYHRIPENARVMDKGIAYKVLYCDRSGAAVRRMDETNATVSFTQAEINERLNRPGSPMTIEYGFYAPEAAKKRLKNNASMGVLSVKEQDEIGEKEFFVRQYFEMEAKYKQARRAARISGQPAPEPVSRSREPLLRVIPIIAEAWHKLQSRSLGRAATYRKTRNVQYFVPKPSTVKGWISKMEQSDFDPLCLKNNYRHERPEYFTPDELAHLHQALRQACSLTKPDISAIHRDMVSAIERDNEMRGPDDQLRIPHEDTLRNRYNAQPEMWRDLGEDGKEVARRKWQPEHGGIDVIRPLERVEFDDHETDLQTLLVKIGVWKTLTKAEKKKVKRIRLWISAMICVATRSIIALHVSTEDPSSKSVMATLEMSTRDKTEMAARLGCKSAWVQGGTSETIAVDSATYFAYRGFRVAVNDMGTDLFLPPAGEAWWRGYIERWFLTLSHQMFNYFHGRTWGSPEAKGKYDAEEHAAAMAYQVAQCLIRWVVDAYHNAEHEGLNNATPNDMWLQLSRDHGVLPGPTGALRTHLFGTYVTRVISKKGYRVAGLYFQSKELQRYRRKKKGAVMGRVNNHDLFSISVMTDDGWIEVPCVHPELEGVSIWKWLAASERLKLFNKNNAKASRKTLLDTFAWLKTQAEMAHLEAGLASPVLTDEDYLRFEKKMDQVFDLVDSPVQGEPRAEGEWHPSNELFSALGIQPVVYAKAKPSAKAIREKAEAEGRPAVGAEPKETAAPPLDDAQDQVVQRTSNIFDNK
ncbi:Mu transposase C-terminal domain-containing protein [Rhizobium binae]|uniref:Mu transposase C-terminal domain-containing protein n=1 Tax=Rhizobium binae TaxID=1138190 RepID=UPI001C83E2DA|nr:Mu transposase C-terminal domain-containing protein [Rhizobium binae]MBX4963676.1 hypothetical protein [Rhizobium binae]